MMFAPVLMDLDQGSMLEAKWHWGVATPLRHTKLQNHCGSAMLSHVLEQNALLLSIKA
tara:strand:+ start:722 stop:895 length:174 start_codon:yes stop_codon:yes gene_type:complete